MAEQYERPLIVPMTLIHPGHRQDVFEHIQKAEVKLLHVLLELPTDTLVLHSDHHTSERLAERVHVRAPKMVT